MDLGPDELDDAHWLLIEKYLNVQMQILKLTEPAAVFKVMKLHWAVLQDVVRLEDFVDRAELAGLKTNRDTENLNRPARDARIVELEAKTG